MLLGNVLPWSLTIQSHSKENLALVLKSRSDGLSIDTKHEYAEKIFVSICSQDYFEYCCMSNVFHKNVTNNLNVWNTYVYVI